jgi:hypothetical protein
VEVRFSGQSYGNLRPIDLQVNSRVKRDRNGQVELVGEARSDGGTPVEKAITQSGELWEDA